MVACQTGLNTALCHGTLAHKGLWGHLTCQASVASAPFRYFCPILTRLSLLHASQCQGPVSDRPQIDLLPRHHPLQYLLGHGRVSDRSIIGLLPRPPCLQGSLEAPCVSGWCRIGDFPVSLPYPATAIPATGIPVAGSHVRPVNYRPSATVTPVTGICEASPRVRLGACWVS